jgi:PadR family transcriptional regulator, regulatory protein PadR
MVMLVLLTGASFRAGRAAGTSGKKRVSRMPTLGTSGKPGRVTSRPPSQPESAACRLAGRAAGHQGRARSVGRADLPVIRRRAASCARPAGRSHHPGGELLRTAGRDRLSGGCSRAPAEELLLHIDTIGRMAGIERVTPQLLDLLFVLLDASVRGEELHGYAIKKRAGLSGPSTYRGLDRLERDHLIEARWEDLPETAGRPRRCYYRLTADGAATARTLLSERRPNALPRLGRTPSPLSPAPRPGFGAQVTAFLGLAGGAR